MPRAADQSERRDEHWIYTWSGHRFWPLDPIAEEIAIEDIAGSLSQHCRFGGHSRTFYSVAQHSVLVASILEEEEEDAGLFGLLHDAAEAYLTDLPRPLKRSEEMAGYREAEARLMVEIASAFALPHEPPQSLAWADEILLATEVRDLMHPRVAERWRPSMPPLPTRLQPWPPEVARERFLACYDRLSTNDSAVRSSANERRALLQFPVG